MQLPEIIEQSGQRVLTTAQLAEAYGTDSKTISWNFNHNRARYEEGRHFYLVSGDEMKQIFAVVNFTNANKIRQLYLWTECGALLHAKSLNTDKAWEVFGFLVENYFRAKAESKPDYSELSPQLQFMIQMEQRQNQLEKRLAYSEASQKAIHDMQVQCELRQSELSARLQIAEEDIAEGKKKAYVYGWKAAQKITLEEQKLFRRLVKAKAESLCDGQHPFKIYGAGLIKTIYGEIHKKYGIKSYTELRRVDFEDAFDFVYAYQVQNKN